MKNLLYKEFKLSIHPLTYFFIALMALSAVAPTFPAFVPLVYFGATYTFLFIGMNKTTTTNDLLYTCLLPIKRNGVVKARVFSTTTLQLIELAFVIPLFLINHLIICPNILAANPDSTEAVADKFLNMNQGLVLVSVYLICYAIFDLIYLPWFYKTGKSIILNMLVAILVIMIVGFGLTSLSFIKSLKNILSIGNPNSNYFLQIIIFVLSIGIWIGSKFLVIKLSTKNLVKLDF